LNDRCEQDEKYKEILKNVMRYESRYGEQLREIDVDLDLDREISRFNQHVDKLVIPKDSRFHLLIEMTTIAKHTVHTSSPSVLGLNGKNMMVHCSPFI
jgi:deoxycytidine triphosphate deaminase